MKKQRITHEKRTVELMIRLYCRKKEKNTALCPDCEELLRYAHASRPLPVWGEEEFVQEVHGTLLQTGNA